jgi:hypothetical protein
VGWWALPGVRQAGIDTAWTDICRPLGLFEYLHDVVVEHKNWRTGKRPYDEGDNWEREGHDYITDDVHAKMLWETSEDYRQVLDRLVAHAPLTAGPRARAVAAQQLSAGMASPGMPAARRARLEAEKAG